LLFDTRPGTLDSLFRNWIAISVATALLWLARRGTFGPLPSFLRRVSAVELPLFGFIVGYAILLWPPIWTAVNGLGLDAIKIETVAISTLIAVWVLGCVFLIFRGFFRWFRKRYEHHGFAVGLGPLYFYFRRRRV